jgi:hypothetical protein
MGAIIYPTENHPSYMSMSSADPVLQSFEMQWWQRLRSLSIVAELAVSRQDRLRVSAALGKLHCSGQRDLASRWPACVAVTMVGSAGEHYSEHTFWTYFCEELGIGNSSGNHQIWGEYFEEVLHALDLFRFPSSRLRYVSQILPHAGVPRPCLETYFKFVLKHLRQSAEALQQGIATAGIPAVRYLHQPVREFLRLGGEFAVDYLERSATLLNRLATPPGGQEDDLRGLGFPINVIETARAVLHDNGGRLGKLTHDLRPLPLLMFDAAAGDLRIHLPEMESADGSTTWTLEFEGESRTVVAEDDWSDSKAPAEDWSVPRPVATVKVTAADGIAQTIEVVDKSFPLLVFDLQGASVPLDRLRRDQVWIVHPADRDLERAGGMRECAAIAPTMRAWSAWRMRLVDLAEVSQLGLNGSERVITLAGDNSRPRLEFAREIPGITSHGHVVHAVPPHVTLPDHTKTDEWLVEVTELTTAGQTRTRVVGHRDIWKDCERPLLGRFTVAVRGPLGRGLREREFVIAEGLGVSYDAPIRHLNFDGLEPTKVELSLPNDSRALPIEFMGEVVSRDHTLRSADRSLPVQITPPHMAVRVESSAAESGWSERALFLEMDAFLNDPGLLRIQALESSAGAEVQLRSDDGVVQHASTSQRNGVHTIDLRKFTDTLRVLTRAELWFHESGRSSPLLALAPATLASGAEWTSSGLRLQGVSRHLQQVSASIAADTAPWMTPASRPVSPTGRVHLEDTWREYGPLTVRLRLRDPRCLATTESSLVGEPFAVDAPGYMPSEDENEDTVSRALAGGPFPGHLDYFVPLWHALAADMNGPFVLQQWEREIRRTVRASRNEAIADFADAEVCFEDQIRILVTSGLAADFHDVEPEFATYLWPIAPAAAVLKGGLRKRECQNAARQTCGGGFDSLFRNPAEDLRGHLYRFDRDTDILARSGDESLARLGRDLDPPMPLLSVQARRAAALQLASVHRDPRLAAARAQGGELVQQILRTIGGYLARHMQKRKHPCPTEGWHYLAWLSTGLALLARSGARGDRRAAGLLEQHHAVWTSLAQCAPRIMTIDLVVAELLLTGMEHS